jgi:prepilin-type N-terminal cleavage/methylation domain-containing protein
MYDRKGSTLIELLVVIAIIGILSTLAVIALNSARQVSWCRDNGIKTHTSEQMENCADRYRVHLDLDSKTR